MYHYSSPLSNNPFVGDPTTAHARFPNIDPSYLANGHPQQYQQYPAQPYPQAISPQGQYPPQAQMSIQPTNISAFQPTGFAPQLPQQYPIQTGYPYTGGYPQQTTNATPSYLPEFDPYAQQAQQALAAQSQTQPAQTLSQQSHVTQSTSGTGPGGISHPRDLIRTQKAGLEAWDAYSWRQLFNAFDALKAAWAARKQEAERIVRQYGGQPGQGLFGPDPAFGYNSQVEGWRQVLKDANDYFDTITASTFQLHEVYNSYRQSGDHASKQRVRESCNAAVRGLPDWPGN